MMNRASRLRLLACFPIHCVLCLVRTSRAGYTHDEYGLRDLTDSIDTGTMHPCTDMLCPCTLLWTLYPLQGYRYHM